MPFHTWIVFFPHYCSYADLVVYYIVGAKKCGTKENQTGYSNNFGELSGGGPTVQGQIMVLVSKSLLSKFVENKKDLTSHENVVCMFVSWIELKIGAIVFIYISHIIVLIFW